MDSFTILDLLNLDLKEHEALGLHCVAGRSGLGREIKFADLNRPGLSLNGFFDNFASDRIQIFGRGENAFIQKIFKDAKWSSYITNLKKIFSSKVPCAIFTHSMEPRQEIIEIAEETNTPILITSLSTSEFNVRVIRALSTAFAHSLVTHGVLVEVFGIGIFIIGESGVGKSESALELIHRGHRLVADDSVEIRNVAGNLLIGTASNKVLGHHMEIRGLGIINVSHLFGVGSIRDRKRIQLIVELEHWDSGKSYDRLGIEEKTKEILNIKVPWLLVPVRPGRNIPIIIETAAMNERLKKMGYHSVRDFNSAVMKWMEHEEAKKLEI